MKTAIIGAKDFRQNVSKYIQKAQDEHMHYIITVHKKPVFEVSPCFNEEIFMDETQIAYYKTLEETLDFWNDEADDNIFAV